jgi:hypothetical protein
VQQAAVYTAPEPATVVKDATCEAKIGTPAVVTITLFIFTSFAI